MATENDRPRIGWGVHLTCYLLLTAVFIYVGVVRWRRPLVIGDHPAVEPDRIARVETRIDPNTARWSELARLPEVGESLAREIVAYREAHRAPANTTTAPTVIFRSIKDLDPIPGIGDKTLEKIEPFLKFPSNE
jgi:DNA uptake protein ComE-like DNA-binding protein